MLSTKNLASGYLPTVKAAIFTASKPTILRAFRVVNKDTVERTFTLYFYNGLSEVPISPYNFILGPGYKTIESEPITMTQNHEIRGEASVANMLAFKLDGSEEDQPLA